MNGFDKYYQEQASIDKKLLFSLDEVQEMIDSDKKKNYWSGFLTGFSIAVAVVFSLLEILK